MFIPCMGMQASLIWCVFKHFIWNKIMFPSFIRPLIKCIEHLWVFFFEDVFNKNYTAMYHFPKGASIWIFPYRFTIVPLTNDTQNKLFRDIITYIKTPITSWKQIEHNKQSGGSLFIILSYLWSIYKDILSILFKHYMPLLTSTLYEVYLFAETHGLSVKIQGQSNILCIIKSCCFAFDLKGIVTFSNLSKKNNTHGK